MSKHRLEVILKEIAKEHHTTPQQVRMEMEDAMRQAQASTDPVVQAKWAAIPKKGRDLTLEEFIEYCTVQLRSRSL